PLQSLHVKNEADFISARQTARRIAQRAGLNGQDQARIATAVSEVVRNALQYAGSGRVDFSLDYRSTPAMLMIEISDKGPGIVDENAEPAGAQGIGLSGSRRLMDHFKIESQKDSGTTVSFGKFLPSSARPLLHDDIERLRDG